MIGMLASYFREVIAGVSNGWNRFWYAPSDPQPLAVIRILAGLLTLYIVGSFTPDLVRFFAADGLLPTSLLEQWPVDTSWFLGDPWRFSYLRWLSSPTELYIAHALGLLVVLAMTLGLFTRITTVLSLIVLLSYVHRGSLVSGIAEPVLAMVLFYLCFGPSGAWLSIDAWRSGKPPLASSSATIALRLMQLHTAAIFLMMGLAKLTGEVWLSGTAVWWLASRPESRLIDLTAWLAPHPRLVDGWTHAIMITELLFAVLIWNRLARPLLLLAVCCHLVSLALLTGDIPFCLALGVAALSFVDPAFWSALIGNASRQAVVNSA